MYVFKRVSSNRKNIVYVRSNLLLKISSSRLFLEVRLIGFSISQSNKAETLPKVSPSFAHIVQVLSSVKFSLNWYEIEPSSLLGRCIEPLIGKSIYRAMFERAIVRLKHRQMPRWIISCVKCTLTTCLEGASCSFDYKVLQLGKINLKFSVGYITWTIDVMLLL